MLCGSCIVTCVILTLFLLVFVATLCEVYRLYKSVSIQYTARYNHAECILSYIGRILL